MLNDLHSIKDLAGDEIEKSDSLRQVQELRIKYLGKKGIITGRIKSLGAVSPEDRRNYGQLLNEVKTYIEDLLCRSEKTFKAAELNRTLQTQRIDVTLPGYFIPPGHLHPTTQVLDEIVDVFTSLGFHVEEGPEVELDFYNFEN